MSPSPFLTIVFLSGCELGGERIGTCDDSDLVLELSEYEDETLVEWSGTLEIDGESLEAFGGRGGDGESVVIVPLGGSPESAMTLRGRVGPAGFNGECGSAWFILEEYMTGGDALGCILTVGFACDGSTETREEAVARLINNADAEELDGELGLLRPDPF